MAYSKDQSKTSSNPTTDGYLNISAMDKDGVPHKVGRYGIQLSDSRLVDRSILNKVRSLPEGESLELSLTFSVVLSGNTDEADDIEL